jgi:hypothetical protein
MHFYWLLLSALTVWRITHLLQAEDGPWNLIARLRSVAGNSSAGDLLDCFYCLSLWAAAPFAYWVGENWKEKLLLWPALSAGAILFEKLASREHEPAQYFEESEEKNVLLRKGERTVSESELRH